MEFQTWLAYFGVAFVNIVTPGAAVLLAVTTGVQYGSRGAFFTALGNVTGLALLASLSAAGLGVVVLASEVLLGGVKWVGVLYLIYLGIAMALSKRNVFIEEKAIGTGKTPFQFFAQALTLAISNPSQLLFSQPFSHNLLSRRLYCCHSSW
jgi:homoserine/homoserine lactone efflux protein